MLHYIRGFDTVINNSVGYSSRNVLVEIIFLKPGMGFTMGDCSYQDRNYGAYGLEMAWNHFWREFGVEWGRYCCMDSVLVVVVKERKGYLGINWDAAHTLGVYLTRLVYLPPVTGIGCDVLSHNRNDAPAKPGASVLKVFVFFYFFPFFPIYEQKSCTVAIMMDL